MLLELNQKQKGLTLAGITAVAILTSLVIGRRLIPQTILAAIAFYLFTADRPKIVYSTIVALPRDVKAILKFFHLNILLTIWDKTNKSVAAVFDSVVKNHPHKTAFFLGDDKMTFKEVQDMSVRIAHYFNEQKLQKGDTVSLLMETKLEYPCVWLGLSRLGVVTALINSNLTKETLKHSIIVANSKAIIVSTEMAGAIQEISDDDGIKGLPVYILKEKGDERESKLPDAEDLRLRLDSISSIDLSSMPNDILPKDKLVYIFTSGTTGMPKAAVITNIRYMFMVLGCNVMLSVRNDDVIYNSLPLYHSAGGMIGVGNVLLRGVTMALRKKFSASNFWTDCIKYKCTVAQYIGEICRFVLMTPEKPQDTEHSVRMVFGNGLRPQIWKQFASRFNIQNIGEFYGSTEGNSNLINIDSTIGSVGFVPKFAESFYPVTLIRCDDETGEILRDSRGFCMKCNAGESGVLVGQINPKKILNSFVGYADKKASEKKVLNDVFKKGDFYFDSGDILVMDLLSNFYFKDRTGDTFRWRGENVATSEVEAVISNIVGLKDCAVYGVDVPETEGKAGMAAIVDPDNKICMENLSNGIRSSLPSYARPLFIRVLTKLPMTGTFKLKKRDLQLEGYNTEMVKDPIYFLNNDGFYREFSVKNYDDVKNCRARL